MNLPFKLLVACCICVPSALAQVPTFVERAKLTALDATDFDDFGWSLDLDGDTLVVGAPRDDGAAPDAGAVYVFERAANGWTQTAELHAPDAAAGDELGWAVAVSGDLVLAGAPRADLPGAAPDTSEGAAYVFRREASGWAFRRKLTASVPQVGARFGTAVDAAGDTALVGAYREDVRPHAQSGAAYVFREAAGVWSTKARLTGSFGGPRANFGFALELSGERAIVGAYAGPGIADPVSGTAYVFVRNGTSWSEEGYLGPADVGAGGQYGISVALDDDQAFVGAPIKNVALGFAYVFGRTGNTWSERQQVTPPAQYPFDQFARSVELHGDVAVVGDPFGPDGSGKGAAHVYRRGTDGSWREDVRLVASDVAPTLFDYTIVGWSIALDGSTIAVGSPWNAGTAIVTGAVYVFDLPSATFCDARDGALAGCPCGAGAPESGCDTPAGTGGVALEALLQRTTPTNRVTLQGTGFPAQESVPAIALRSGALAAAGPVVFGDGLRCVGTPLVRVGTASASAGVSTHVVGHGANAGTFFYQLWYATLPASFCDPAAAFSLSSGRAVSW